MNSAQAFLHYWQFAFLVITPLAILAIAYDARRYSEWPLVLKRLVLALCIAVALGSAVYAAEVPDPATWCDGWNSNPPSSWSAEWVVWKIYCW